MFDITKFFNRNKELNLARSKHKKVRKVMIGCDSDYADLLMSRYGLSFQSAIALTGAITFRVNNQDKAQMTMAMCNILERKSVSREDLIAMMEFAPFVFADRATVMRVTRAMRVKPSLFVFHLKSITCRDRFKLSQELSKLE